VSVSEPNHLVLIVTNSDFDDPQRARLSTPARDAEALAAVLADPAIGNFDVTLRVDEPEGVVRREIARLYRRRRKRDLLLLLLRPRRPRRPRQPPSGHPRYREGSAGRHGAGRGPRARHWSSSAGALGRR
jgi:hypothetical protein